MLLRKNNNNYLVYSNDDGVFVNDSLLFISNVMEISLLVEKSFIDIINYIYDYVDINDFHLVISVFHNAIFIDNRLVFSYNDKNVVDIVSSSISLLLDHIFD